MAQSSFIYLLSSFSPKHQLSIRIYIHITIPSLLIYGLSIT